MDHARDAEFVCDTRNCPGQAFVANDDSGRGIFEDRTQFVFGIGRIERDNLGAGGSDGECRNSNVDGVAHDERDAFAPHVAAELSGKSGNACPVPAIRQLFRAAPQCHPIRRSIDGRSQHMQDRRIDRRHLGHRASSTEITTDIAVSPAAHP